MPRPALFLVGYIASSLYLLEHATQNREDTERAADLEVFERWVLEGGLVAAIEDVVRTKKQGDARALADSKIAFAAFAKSKL